MLANIITTEINPKYIYIFGVPLETLLAAVTILAVAYAVRSFMVSRRSNELKTVPTLILKHISSPGKASSMGLINLTKKIAYDISIDPVFFRNDVDAGLYKINFILSGENYIKANESRPLVEYKLKDGAIEESINFSGIIAASGTTSKHPVVIRFKDVQGISYFTEINFKHGDEKFVRPPKKLTKFWKLRLWIRAYRRFRVYNLNESRKFARLHPSLAQRENDNIRPKKIKPYF